MGVHEEATVRVALRLHARGIYRPYNLFRCNAISNSETISNLLAVSRDHSNTVRLKEKLKAKRSKGTLSGEMGNQSRPKRTAERDVQEAGAAEETGLTLGWVLLHEDNIPNAVQALGTETHPATS